MGDNLDMHASSNLYAQVKQCQVCGDTSAGSSRCASCSMEHLYKEFQESASAYTAKYPNAPAEATADRRQKNKKWKLVALGLIGIVVGLHLLFLAVFTKVNIELNAQTRAKILMAKCGPLVGEPKEIEATQAACNQLATICTAAGIDNCPDRAVGAELLTHEELKLAGAQAWEDAGFFKMLRMVFFALGFLLAGVGLLALPGGLFTSSGRGFVSPSGVPA